MPTITMTDRGVAGLRSTERRTYFDRTTAGLALRVGAKSRTWYFTYRNGGPTEWIRLGLYPAVTLADARDQARTLRRRIDVEGLDPAVARRTPPPEPETPPPTYTFADFVPVFLACQRGRIKDWKNQAGMIAGYLSPAWDTRALKDITRADVQDLLDQVAATGLTVGVNRIQALISRLFTVALDKGKIDAHPAARIIKRFKEHPRDRVLTDDELRALWAGLHAHPGAPSDAVKLRLLLGQRGAETAGMHWREIDLDAALWTIPRPRTKTQKRAHVVPLPASALGLVTARRAAVAPDEPRVFPALALIGDDHRALGSIHGGAYTWKDLRRTVATRLADLGFDETTIGRVLNHARVSVTSKHYNQHAYVEEIRQALVAWDAELHRILTKQPKKARARLVRMSQAR
jgi:integrase